MTDFNLSDEEKRAIAALKRLAKKWPDTLWIFAADGKLCIMPKTEEGTRFMTVYGGVDPEYIIDTINIEADGGDW